VFYAAGEYGLKGGHKEAAKWLRRAAMQGHPNAEFSLGIAYAEGRGVERDPQQSLGWLRRAAEHGHGAAIEYVRRIEARMKPE
jgi:TPR repeat protein